MAEQYLRYCSLIVADEAGNGLQLDQLAVGFSVQHGTYTYPDTADIHVYNAAPGTLNRLLTEFTRVALVAGYQENYGLIFTGSIKQVFHGKENAIDTFFHIRAADGDTWHNFGIINTTLQAGHTQADVWQSLGGALKPYNPTAPLQAGAVQPNAAPRGRVMFGPIRKHLRNFANTNNLLVTTDNGSVKALGLYAYKPGQVIVINSASGMVGTPEQTEMGIMVTCLLNPAIAWGTRIQLNNADITQAKYTNYELERMILNKENAPAPIAGLDPDGIYKVLAVDHVGETRGQGWYTKIIAISMAPANTGISTQIEAAVLGLKG